MRLILGSASPRRLELLASVGIIPDAVQPADINEDPDAGELPRLYCSRIARAKAVAINAPNTDVVLCADTTVALGRRILGKPDDAADAKRFLSLLSGRRHKVITSVVVRREDRIWQRDVEARVKMKRLTESELHDYIASGDWQGKAGGYGIQGRAGAFCPWICGSYTAIVGLPVAETVGLLNSAGYKRTVPCE